MFNNVVRHKNIHIKICDYSGRIAEPTLLRSSSKSGCNTKNNRELDITAFLKDKKLEGMRKRKIKTIDRCQQTTKKMQKQMKANHQEFDQ